MTKILHIECCDDCSRMLFDFHGETGNQFDFCKKTRKKIDNSGIIQDWCELKDLHPIDKPADYSQAWVSVKDKLPPKLAPGQYETYLVVSDDYVRQAHWLWGGKFCTRMDGCSDVKPTHWMPFPAPPKENR